MSATPPHELLRGPEGQDGLDGRRGDDGCQDLRDREAKVEPHLAEQVDRECDGRDVQPSVGQLGQDDRVAGAPDADRPLGHAASRIEQSPSAVRLGGGRAPRGLSRRQLYETMRNRWRRSRRPGDAGGSARREATPAVERHLFVHGQLGERVCRQPGGRDLDAALY